MSARGAVGADCAGGMGACPGQSMLPIPSDPSERGPWPVGLRTVVITERNMTVDVLYPAVVGSEAGVPNVVYSIRDEHLPPRQAAKIPDEDDPPQPVRSQVAGLPQTVRRLTTHNPLIFLSFLLRVFTPQLDAYRDLPLDTEHGPYPVHIHVHGTAAFRSASAHQLTHMASRGFVVLAADHPGITLYDMMRLGNGQEIDQEGDLRRTIAELEQLTDPQLQFLAGHFNISMLAVSGHSAGGGAVAGMGDKAAVIMAWASGGVDAVGPMLRSTLVLGGEEDGIVAYRRQQSGYEDSPAPKRLVGIARAGHLWCTDLCWIGEEDGGIVQIAIEYDAAAPVGDARCKVLTRDVPCASAAPRCSHGIYMAYLFQKLGTDGCGEDNVKNHAAWNITNYAISAAQEAVLLCDPSMDDRLAEIELVFADIYEYREQLAKRMRG